MHVFFGMKGFKNTKKNKKLIGSICSKVPTNDCFAGLSSGDSALDYYSEYFSESIAIS